MTELAIAGVPSRDIITRLPFELLQEIFMIVRDWEIAGVCAGQWNVTVPERLSAVSSSWRQVAFQIPLLWNTIQFHRYADPTWLNEHLSERHQRHLQLSKDLPIDIIISSTAQIPTPVYPFSIFPMGRVRRIFVRRHSPVAARTFLQDIVITVNLLQRLHTRFSKIDSIDLHMVGESVLGFGNHPRVLQLNLKAKRDGTDTTMRSVVQGVNINMAVDVETLLRDIIQVDLGNVTHFQMGNVSLVSSHYLRKAFTRIGTSLRDLALGPLPWQRIPWQQVLLNVPKLKSLKLYHNIQVQIYNSTSGRIVQSHTFQSVLDALPVIESQLPQLSQLHLLTTSRYNAESTVQFVQLFNMNASRGDRTLDLTVTRRTFGIADFEALEIMTKLVVVD